MLNLMLMELWQGNQKFYNPPIKMLPKCLYISLSFIPKFKNFGVDLKMAKKKAEVEEIKTCPECGSTRLIWDYERGELICQDCSILSITFPTSLRCTPSGFIMTNVLSISCPPVEG